ncbi:13016_t:CDS:10 [Dentiscutata erythropus]|uniref:13016_t:CDS:1 n=1 Tax=Dentiscutata erythropus TaxID=1348616 RepID=A0A9N9GDH8_9GLOM|nr:13016_t:CDS:10 [Dentiscutata erythropus]
MAERRKEELKKKKEKLAELKRAREERKSTPPAPAPAESQKEKTKKDELDALLLELLPKQEPKVEAPEKVPENEIPTTPDPTCIIDTKAASNIIPQNIITSSGPATPTLSSRFIPDFTTFEAVILDVPPKEIVHYNKEVQTAATSFEAPPPSEDEIREKVRMEFEEQQKAKEAAAAEQRARQEAEKKKELKLLELSDEEMKNILNSSEFHEFVTHSTKMVERMLTDNFYDHMKDYTFNAAAERDENEGARVRYLFSFFDDRWSKNRFVTDVNWSHKNPELCVASYNKNPYNMNDPDGVVLIWNLRLIGRPEFVFHSQSDVLTTMFSEFHPSAVLGGTYSGQILLWDMRAKSLPVLKTPLSTAGHTHPVYSMQMVGTQNAHNLITASTDGTVCSWQLETLLQPTETLELVHSGHNKTDEVSVTSFGFPENETSTFWVGTEEGNVYQANRFGHAGGKAGINQYDSYKGHWGPVTGLHFHPLVGPVDFSDLFLTSSVDWTVKLWKAKSVSKPSASAQTISPLYSFEGSDDYIYDVKWSPTNPALFGSVDGKGNFAVWNLNEDTEIPAVNTQVGNGRALNKLQWDKEGRRVAIGSSDGRVHVYDVGELCNPREDEWIKMQKTLSEMNESGEMIGKMNTK